MSDVEHAPAAPSDGHAAHDDGHGHESAGEPLGPIDMGTWAYAIVAGAVGVVVALAMFVAGGG
jgi:hypothetical protein